MKRLLLLSTFVSLSFTPAYTADYKIDTDHSSVTFTIRHVLSKVTGRFDKFSGTFSYDPKDPKAWKTEATIDAASINTNNEKRDKHLRTADFFDVEKYKTINFVSSKVTDVKGNKAKVHGKLTIHGVTKDAVLDVEDLGAGKDPWGNQIASFSAKTKINRKDYGLKWNQALESGGVLVGDEVEINLDIAGLEQAAPAKASEEKKK